MRGDLLADLRGVRAQGGDRVLAGFERADAGDRKKRREREGSEHASTLPPMLTHCVGRLVDHGR